MTGLDPLIMPAGDAPGSFKSAGPVLWLAVVATLIGACSKVSCVFVYSAPDEQLAARPRVCVFES